MLRIKSRTILCESKGGTVPHTTVGRLAGGVLVFTSAFLGVVGAIPLTTQGYNYALAHTIPIQPAMPQAEPGIATADVLAALNGQGIDAKVLDYVGHNYLAGRGTLIAFAGDNIQIFEYASNDIARREALAVFDRAPRLKKESFFHLYINGNVVGLYFGHNAAVMQATQEVMGSPL